MDFRGYNGKARRICRGGVRRQNNHTATHEAANSPQGGDFHPSEREFCWNILCHRPVVSPFRGLVRRPR